MASGPGTYVADGSGGPLVIDNTDSTDVTHAEEDEDPASAPDAAGTGPEPDAPDLEALGDVMLSIEAGTEVFDLESEAGAREQDEQPGEQGQPGEQQGQETPGDTSGGSTAPLHKKMATSASQLFIRCIAVQLLSALSTAILARKLGIAGFGDYSAGLAMYYLALSVCDFGFGNVLARELGKHRADDGRLVRSMLHVQTAWSSLVGLAVVGFCLAVGLGAVRIQVLMVLAPAVALFGLSGVRQVFYANYRTGRLGAIDVSTNVLQLLVVATVAFAGGGPLAVAIALSVMILVNTVVVAVAGLRLIDTRTATPVVRKRMLVDALPLGMSSLLASAYFTLDLSIVGFLVSSREVGYYAAATKALTLLVTVPGLVITAVVPGMSSHAGSPKALGELAGRVWHWLAVTAVPLCVAVMLFAPLFVSLYYGREYRPAVPLVRILAASGVVAVLSNVFGTTMVVTRRNRWLVVQGAIALVFNVAGNLIFVPHFGVTASAWLTVLTELLVCAGSIIGMRHSLEFGPMVHTTLVPALALAAMIAVWLGTRQWSVVSLVTSCLAYGIVLSVLGGWPEELPPIVPRRLVLWKHG